MTTDTAPQPHGLLEGDEDARVVALVGEDDGARIPPGTFLKIGSAMATLVVAIVATYLVPGLHFARPWVEGEPVPFWNIIGRELMGEGAVTAEVEAREEATEVLAQHVLADEDVAPIEDKPIVTPTKTDALPPYRPHPDDAEVPTQAIELPSETALDGFLGRLAKTDAGYAGAVTRVVHWGDSVVSYFKISSAFCSIML
jgi:hypothetical protein